MTAPAGFEVVDDIAATDLEGIKDEVGLAVKYLILVFVCGNQCGSLKSRCIPRTTSAAASLPELNMLSIGKAKRQMKCRKKVGVEMNSILSDRELKLSTICRFSDWTENLPVSRDFLYSRFRPELVF